MVINHLEKLFVTKDAGTVIKELEVEHPAAKMMVMATQMMEQEVWVDGCVALWWVCCCVWSVGVGVGVGVLLCGVWVAVLL